MSPTRIGRFAGLVLGRSRARSRGRGRGRSRARSRAQAPRGDRGSITPLILGLFAIVLVLIVGGVDVTAAQLTRIRLLDASDDMALDGADAIDRASAYSQGLGSQLEVTAAAVRTAAGANLATRPMPPGVTDWSLGPDTGTLDGRSATVQLQAQVDLPLTGGLLEFLRGGMTITVESTARAPLR